MPHPHPESMASSRPSVAAPAGLAFALALGSFLVDVAHAQIPQPCPTPTFQPCNAVVTSTLVRVDHSDARHGYTTGSFIVGGEYGSGTPETTETSNRFSREDLIRATRFVESTAEAGTLDSSMLARVTTQTDLARGTLRARIEGHDATLFPASLMEVSQARADLWLRETVTFHLPAGFSGGKARVRLWIDGAVEDPRPRGTFAATEVVAQLRLGAGSANGETRRWNDGAPIMDEITLAYALIPTATSPIDQLMGIEAFLRLSSGDGDGSYAIDFYNTARLELLVPDGVAWDSASGVFLSAVPEPGSATLLLFGAGILARAANRRGRCLAVSRACPIRVRRLTEPRGPVRGSAWAQSRGIGQAVPAEMPPSTRSTCPVM